PRLSTAPPTTHSYTLSLHDALPICRRAEIREENRKQKSGRDRTHLRTRGGETRAFGANGGRENLAGNQIGLRVGAQVGHEIEHRSEEHTSELQSLRHLVCRLLLEKK